MKNENELFSIDDHGAVTLRGVDFTETWRPWGHPEGFGVTGCKRASYNGQLEPLLVDKILKGCDVGGPLQSITDSIPAEILDASRPFSHWPAEHIQLAECHPVGYVNLSKQNPALLNYLACLSATHTLWGVRHWGALLGHTQQHIALQSGLDPKMVKYLSRIEDSGLLCHGYLELAIGAWKQAWMPRLLTHVQCINLDVLLLAINEWDVVRRCPSLLHVAAKGDAFDTSVFHTVCVIRSALRRARTGWRWDTVRDFRHLERIRDRVLEQSAVGGGDDLVYPPPPISPCSDWKAVTTEQELGELAERHCNCAAEQSWKLAAGLMAIYETRGCPPQEAVIVVLQKEQSRWAVTDVLGTHNSLVDPETEAAVRSEFNGALAGEGVTV